MTGGFFLASVSIGWMKGSYENMIMFFTSGRTGQIQVHGEGYLDDRSIYNMVEGYRSLGEAIGELEEVEGWAPRIYAGGASGFPGRECRPRDLRQLRRGGGHRYRSGAGGTDHVLLEPAG